KYAQSWRREQVLITVVSPLFGQLSEHSPSSDSALLLPPPVCCESRSHANRMVFLLPHGPPPLGSVLPRWANAWLQPVKVYPSSSDLLHSVHVPVQLLLDWVQSVPVWLSSEPEPTPDRQARRRVHGISCPPRLFNAVVFSLLVPSDSLVQPLRHMVPSRWTIRPGWAQRLFIKRLPSGAACGQVSFMIHYRSSASFACHCPTGLVESSVMAARGTSEESPTVPHCLNVRRVSAPAWWCFCPGHNPHGAHFKVVLCHFFQPAGYLPLVLTEVP
ncbi:hypothetical protein T11_3105, partial [Trichinella zimbabwensis]